MTKQYSAQDVARFFLSLVDTDDNDVSNLKLQKLCYYAQGVGLAVRGAPLFKEDLLAWDHGPVIPPLYGQYKENGAQPIAAVDDLDPEMFEESDRELLHDIYDYYGQFSAWRLREMTHNEPPWQNAYKTASKLISLDALRGYFGPLVESEYGDRVYGKAARAKEIQVSQN